MILKYQQGGATIPPLVNYDPVMIQPTQEASTVAETKKEEKGLADKDILGLLKDLNGLPNDVQVATQLLQNFFIDRQYMPKEYAPSIASQYIQLINRINRIKFDSAAYEDAYKAANSKGSLSEYAIDDRGNILCKKGEDFQFLRPEQLEGSGYTPLTNSDVLRLRAYAPQLAYNNSLLDIVKSSTSMEVINKQIKDIISNLGSTTQSSEGYTRSAQLISGMNQYLAAVKQVGESATPEQLYKGKILTKDQAQQANAAISYVYSSLPENARTLIKTRTKNGTQNEALELVAQLIGMSTSSTSEFQLDLQKSEKGDTADPTNPFAKLKLSPVDMLQAGYGQKDSITIQTPEGGTAGLQVPTVRMPITDKEGKSQGIGTLQDVTNSAFAGYLDFNQASMGGVNIPFEGFSNVAVDGTALHAAYLPVDMEKYRQGEIVPDISMLERYDKAQKKIKQENITDPQEINAVYQEMGLPMLYNSNGKLMGNYIKFGILNGTALSSTFNKDVSLADYIVETQDENEIANTLAILQKGRSEKDRIQFEEKSTLWPWGDYTRVYKGTIFIPINEDYFTSNAATGNFPTTAQAELIEARQQSKQKQYINPGTL